MPEIYQSVVFGMGFWIDNQGYSCPHQVMQRVEGVTWTMQFPCMIGKTGENLQSITTHT